MPPAVKAHYDKLVDNKDFPNKDAESWAKSEFMDPASKAWRNLPDFNSLTEEELKILYRDLAETFANMSAHSAILDDKAKTFLNNHYGPRKLFNVPEINSEAKAQIRELLKLLFSGDNEIDNASVMNYEESKILEAAHHNSRKLDSPEVKSAIYNVIQKIKDKSNYSPDFGGLSDGAKSKFFALRLNYIQKSLQTNIEPEPNDLNRLKTEGPAIFESLFKEKGILEAFKKYEPGDKIVSDQIDAALTNTDYTGKIKKDSYIAPTYKDADPNLRQKIDKGFKNFYSDVLKKFVTVHRANIFIKPTSKAIFAAIDKAKIQPTDNLNALIDKSSDIENALRGKEPFKAADHFKWLTEKLSVYKSNGLSDSIEGALRWGYQMNRIVTELIKEAVKDGKLEEAKTALEVLSVMQYGTFTSRTMDAVNGTDVKIFSDGDLSWNKNEGIRFVTGAVDKTMKFGLEATGYLATGIINRARRRHSMFNNSGELRNLSDQRKIALAAQRTADEKKKKADDRADNVQIRDNNAVITAARTHIKDTYAGLTIRQAQSFVNKHENEIRTQKALAAEALGRMEDNEQAHNEFETNQKIVEDFDKIPDRIKEAEKRQKEIKKQIDERHAILSSKGAYGTYNDPITGTPMSETAAADYEVQLNDEIRQLRAEFDNVSAQIEQLKHKQADPAEKKKRDDADANKAKHKAGNDAYLAAKTDYDNAQAEFEKLSTDEKYLDIESTLTQYSDAKEAKEKAKEAKRLRETEWQKWDQKNRNDYEYLMAYWDFLQTGQTKSMFHWSTKALQKKMDQKNANGRTQIEQMFENYKANNY